VKGTRILNKCLYIAIFSMCCCSKNPSYSTAKNILVFEEKFDSNLDSWVIEQMSDGTVEIIDGEMEISQKNGAVVWLKKKLVAPVEISYEITVVDQGGKNDRLADMNCFWMANDPENPDDFFHNSASRGGIFSKYFNLSLYYVGQGGHDNTKTRFRKYNGSGDRPLDPKHDLNQPQYLLKPNHKNYIKIEVSNGTTSYYCNNQLIYNIEDENLYSAGYFAIRSFKNHLKVDNLRITKL
jgi:hypothetical protein